MLSFPDVARWWIEKVFPMERQLLAAARPLARTLLDIQLPTPEVFGDVQRLSHNLIALNELLRDHERCTIRLVMNPDRMVIGEAMRTFTYLNLYGYLTDAVIVNRVFPHDVGDYFAAWRQVQEQHLGLARSAFAPVPVLEAPYFDQEVTGPAMLDRLGETLFSDRDAALLFHDRITQELVVDDDVARLRLSLPLTSKGDISLKKVGSDLVVAVGDQRRTIGLPTGLAGSTPAGASFEEGLLEVRFELVARAVEA
jgi:arsenite-transporting ATPase